MRITYTAKDPRAGMTVEMGEDRARELIDSGAAKKVGTETESVGHAPAVTAPAPVAKKATKATKKGR